MAVDAVADGSKCAEFGILGPLEVRRSGRTLPLGGPRQRAVLALLLLEANRVVSMDRLAEDVWGGSPPEGWAATLQTYVFHLRQALEPGRSRGAAGGVLVTKDRGYLLRVSREHLDAALFQDGFTTGRTALEAGWYAEAAATLRRALDLWRGQVLDDLANYAYTRPEAARLEELRLAALEARIDADLQLGRHDGLTAELEQLAAEYPLREQLRGQLILALYRSGRQADALSVYQRLRRTLGEELGIDPSQLLRDLETAILRQDPSLDAPAPAVEVLAARQGVMPGAFAAAATRTLPRDVASFTGRGAKLSQLLGAIDDLAANGGAVGIYAIGGMAGIGKTAFAVHAAHRLADRFPAGQIFLPLHGHTPGQRPVDPGDALASLLLTAGVASAQIPPGLEARMALWRDRLAGRQLLLVLDDAASSDQGRPLLPGAGGCLVLVTSRRHLTALDDAQAISLDTLPPGEAAALLVRLAARAGLSPPDPAVGELTRLCDCCSAR